MKYKGTELTEFTSNETVVFNPPRKMLVWDNDSEIPAEHDVLMYHANFVFPAISKRAAWRHCADIPKYCRVTNLELAKWLAQGNGVCKHTGGLAFYTDISPDIDEANNECDSTWRVRKWDDKEWHEPTADYMRPE